MHTPNEALPLPDESQTAQPMRAAEQLGIAPWHVTTSGHIHEMAPLISGQFYIASEDGSLHEMDWQKTIFTIGNKDGSILEVSAEATHHILSLHIQGKEAGSTLSGGSLGSFFELVAAHLPSDIPFRKDVAAFEIDVGQTIGNEGVASFEEMKQKGIATDEDFVTLQAAKDEIFRLNIDASPEEKTTYVEDFNKKMTGKVKLGIRGNAIIPFFTADKPPTSKMFLAIGKEHDPDGSVHNRILTMAPGRYMERLPTDETFKDLTNPITKQDQLKAQECWWNHGFIVVPIEKHV